MDVFRNHLNCLEAEDEEMLQYLQDVVIPPPAQLQYDREYLEPFNSVGKRSSAKPPILILSTFLQLQPVWSGHILRQSGF